jgi:hypothetical protein
MVASGSPCVRARGASGERWSVHWRSDMQVSDNDEGREGIQGV